MAQSNQIESPGKKAGEEKKRTIPKEYNAKWKSYLFIFLSSLITSNVSTSFNFRGKWQMGVSFGSVTFATCFLIILFDRTKWLSEKLGDYTKAYDGKLEGGVLTVFVIWWVIGVSYQTQVNGIAYLANNVYFSAWMTLALCVYTLNQWSTDILSIAEITSISRTLSSWYLLLFGSVVVTGTSIQLWLDVHDEFLSESALGIAVGTGSVFLCSLWILAHYNFIEVFNEGGWLELSSSFIAILIWIVGVSVLTQEGAVGATLIGDGCRNGIPRLDSTPGSNCTVIYVDNRGRQKSQTCDNILNRLIPGSNMYAGLWLCLGASLNIAFKWKQQQAQNFAHAQNTRVSGKRPEQVESGRDAQDEDDDDDDLNDFHDADVY